MAEKNTNELLKEIIDGIDVRGNTQWEEEMHDTSDGIRKALINLNALNRLDGASDRFNDYCNRVKSLLVIYNFGKLETKKSLQEAGVPETDSRYAESEARLAQDKKIIKDGIKAILAQVKKYGYYIASPQFGFTDCKEILGDVDDRIEPITFSVTTVFTTLVYFRRACKRLELFIDDELKDGENDLYKDVVAAVAEIMILFVDFCKKNNCAGWGFTLDPEVTKAATLNDTYAVVDAISRYADAFMQNDESKRDKVFTDAVDEYAKGRYTKSLTDCCTGVMYKVAYNVYRRTHDKYGEGIFYANTSIKTDNNRQKYIDYDYQLTTYEQIASSNRSSALFNPLYVAMITMYGYNEKEVVIRRYIEHYDDAYNLYKREGEGTENAIYKYFLKDRQKLGIAEDYDFESEKDLLISQHELIDEYGNEELWDRYYVIARVFQKFMETQHPDELMNIVEYRDYLNATKDAIDQVQVMYRRFDNSQRLGIVDTDYIMFSDLDVATDGGDNISISKLNKANIAVNNLRPMLLSSKILIVNALTKYPQADMRELYSAIKNSRHRKILPKKRKDDGTREKDTEWLWNEDNVDMNSTARHCESIMYDYFDYYDRYELGFIAIRDLKKSIRSTVTDNVQEDGSLVIDLANYDDFKTLLLTLTRNNVDLVKGVYQQKISELDKNYDKKLKEKDDDYQKEIGVLEDKCAKAEDKIEVIKEEHRVELNNLRDSLLIGDTMRKWIREEMYRYMTEFLSQIILNKLNGEYAGKDLKSFEKLFDWNNGEFIDANISAVRDYGAKLREEVKSQPESMSKHAEEFKDTVSLQKLFEAAFNGILDADEVRSTLSFSDSYTIDKKNDEIADRYKRRLDNRKIGQEYAPYTLTKTVNILSNTINKEKQ